jgi:hypothetical protein
LKEKRRVFILKILALTAIFAFIYPAVLVFRTAVFKNDGGISGVLFHILFTYAGYMAGMVIIREQSRFIERLLSNRAVDFLFFYFNKPASVSSLSTIFAYVTLPVPVLTALAIYSSTGIFRMIFEALIVLILYYIGLKANFKSFQDVLSKNSVFTGIIFVAASLFTVYYYKECTYLKPYIFIFAYIFLLFTMIVKNQYNLDYNIFIRKGANVSIIPKSIRRYNITVIILLSIFTMALFYFRDIMIFLLKIAGIVLVGVIRLVFMILALLYPGMEEGHGMGGSPEMLDLPDSGKPMNPVIDFILTVIVCIILLYSAYKAIPAILRMIRRMGSFLVKLIKRLFPGAQVFYDIETVEYKDEIETVKPVRKAAKRRSGARIRSDRRNLKNIVNPVEKIRFIYASFINMLGGSDIRINKSDTTREIYEKASGITGVEVPLKRLTRIYDNVRYGDRVPDNEEVLESEEDYIEIAAKLKKVSDKQ